MRTSRDEPLGATAAVLPEPDDTPAPPRVRAARKGGFLTSLMLVVLTLALIGATALSLGLTGLVLAVWPAAVIDALQERETIARAGRLAGALAASLLVWGLVWLSWRAFAKARTGRCADFMMLALAGAGGVHYVLLAGAF